MPAEDLNTPLSRRAGTSSGIGAGTLFASVLVALAGLLVLTSLIWIALVDDPDGGQPVATARIADLANEPTGSLTGFPDAASPPVETGGAPAADLVALPGPPGSGPLPTVYDELIEISQFGPVPRIGGGGLRPMDAYGRRGEALPPGLPQVVVIVGGMGISPTGTQRAIDVLPEAVTLAFAPYASGLQNWVDAARRDGHEILLQVPLEPVGFPATDPGEHTLLVSADPATLRDDLQWSLARMTGYTGVMNYMGARFTSDPEATGRLLASLAGRGLLYVDDGSSAASRAGEIGMRMGAPVLTADIVLDADRDPAAIDSALAELERIARTRGIAVGTASAFGTTIDVVGEWARSASSRGIGIVSPSSILR